MRNKKATTRTYFSCFFVCYIYLQDKIVVQKKLLSEKKNRVNNNKLKVKGKNKFLNF